MAPVHYHQGGFPPTERLDWQRLAPALADASLALGHYANALRAMPNSDVLLSIMTRQEAVYSSSIEGTQATVEDVLLYEAGHIPESTRLREDIREVINYQAALQQAGELLAEQSLSMDALLEVHQTLLSGVRGQDRNPGAFRANQNWIGVGGGTILDARYVPPGVNRMHEALMAWLDYTLQDSTSPLVRVAIMHAEFEAIHPFSDGNGRLGRILIPLMMWNYGLISKPLFNASVRLEALRAQYMERLLAASRDDDWTGWSVFFMQVVREQACKDLEKMQKTRDLYDRLKTRITEIGRSKYGIHVLDGVFKRPIFTTSDLVDETIVPVRAAQRILERLVDNGILTEVRSGKGQSPSAYQFSEFLRIAAEGD
ncbi:MAG: Fic family protein [Anaerolineaceae bacterium]|nr:Fic family protein [Anaerolineaceae bacterium]